MVTVPRARRPRAREKNGRGGPLGAVQGGPSSGKAMDETLGEAAPHPAPPAAGRIPLLFDASLPRRHRALLAVLVSGAASFLREHAGADQLARYNR